MQKASPLLIILSIFIISCEYRPSDIYISNIHEPEEIPAIDVDLNLLTDTVYFYWPSKVRLKIDAGGKKIRDVTSYLDSKKVYMNFYNSAFITTLSFTGAGTHKFSVSILTSTGTGSLADALGAESYQYNSHEWTLIAMNLNTNVNMTYQLDRNGLSFSWKEYDGIDFKTYRLKELSTRNRYDIQTNSFRLANYAGVQSYYDLYVVDNEDVEHLWGRCNLSKNLPVLKIGNINNKIALIWSANLFKDNISHYEIYQRDYITNWSKIGTVSNNDTALILSSVNNVFGPMLSFYLYCVPSNYTYIDNTSLFSSFLNNVNVALPGPKIQNNPGVSDNSGFYYYNYSSSIRKYILYKYTISDDKSTSISEYSFNYDFSPNAKYMLIPGDSIVSLFDLKDKNIVTSVNMKKIVSGYYPTLYPKVSDNGICVFACSNTLYAYDLFNKKLIASGKCNSSGLKISPNGRYVTADKNDSIYIFRIGESSLTFLSAMKKSVGAYNYGFFPDQDDIFYIYMSSYLSVRASQDFSILRNMNIGPYYFNIDFFSRKILTAKDGSNWNIYDLDTGVLLQTIKSGLGAGASNYTLLTHNIIFYPEYKFYLTNP